MDLQMLPAVTYSFIVSYDHACFVFFTISHFHCIYKRFINEFILKEIEMYDKIPENRPVRGLAARISVCTHPRNGGHQETLARSGNASNTLRSVRSVGCGKNCCRLSYDIPRNYGDWQYFKRLLIKKDIGRYPVSEVYDISPVLPVPAMNGGWISGQRTRTAALAVSAALESEEDFDRLAPLSLRHPKPNAGANYTVALGDAMTVRINPLGSFSAATICLQAAWLRGMEPMMMDMISTPRSAASWKPQPGRAQPPGRWDSPGFPNTESAMLMSDPLRPGGNENQPQRLLDTRKFQNSTRSALKCSRVHCLAKTDFRAFRRGLLWLLRSLTINSADLALPNLKLLTCSAWTDLPTLVDKAAPLHHVAAQGFSTKQFAAEIQRTGGSTFRLSLPGGPPRTSNADGHRPPPWWTDLCDIVRWPRSRQPFSEPA